MAHCKGPLCVTVTSPEQKNCWSSPKSSPASDLSSLMGVLAIGAKGHGQGKEIHQGQCLCTVDFVAPSILVEEEVARGEGSPLKVNGRQKLEKVSPGMWILANSRILTKLLEDKNFNVKTYMKYTDLIGELATCFTWLCQCCYSTMNIINVWPALDLPEGLMPHTWVLSCYGTAMCSQH